MLWCFHFRRTNTVNGGIEQIACQLLIFACLCPRIRELRREGGRSDTCPKFRNSRIFVLAGSLAVPGIGAFITPHDEPLMPRISSTGQRHEISDAVGKASGLTLGPSKVQPDSCH